MAIKQPLMTDAYTGELLTVEKIEGTPLWCVKGGFNPSEWISGVHYDDLKRKLMRREDGKVARKMRCPYKGTKVRIIEDDKGMIRADGAFSPSACVWETRQEAYWDISWRNGVAPAFPREFRITVGEELRPNSNPAEGILEVADNLVDQMKGHLQ